MTISPHNRSFRFGDGIFTTMRLTDGSVHHRHEHLQCLREGSAHYVIPLPPDFEQQLTQQAAAAPAAHSLLRVIITRGDNPADARGYAPPAVLTPTLHWQHSSCAPPQLLWQSLCVLPDSAAMRSPCKTTSAMPYVQAMRHAAARQTDSAVLLDSRGYVCETANSTLYWIRDDTIYTPAVDLPLINGSTRRVLKKYCGDNWREGHFTPQHLLDAEAVFCTNAVQGVSRVRSIDGCPVAEDTPVLQNLFRQLQQAIRGQAPH